MKRVVLFLLLTLSCFCVRAQETPDTTAQDQSEWEFDEEYIIDLMEEEEPLEWTDYALYVLLALLPAVVLFIFILWRDRLRPEPAKELILACAMGLLSVPIALSVGTLFFDIGLLEADTSTWVNCLKMAFLGAAIPEELGKLIILVLFFKWRKHQDEFMDGIVYAACIGLAFAAYENIGYVIRALQMQSLYDMPLALSTSVSRALMSVPGHFGFAIMMGFFYSFYLFSNNKKGLYLALAYFVPVLFHGLYDFFAFMENISDVWGSVISFSFFLVFFAMNNLCIKVTRTALKLDDKIPQ